MKIVDINKRINAYGTGKNKTYPLGKEVVIGELLGKALIANGILMEKPPVVDKVLTAQNNKQRTELLKLLAKGKKSEEKK